MRAAQLLTILATPRETPFISLFANGQFNEDITGSNFTQGDVSWDNGRLKLTHDGATQPIYRFPITVVQGQTYKWTWDQESDPVTGTFIVTRNNIAATHTTATINGTGKVIYEFTAPTDSMFLEMRRLTTGTIWIDNIIV